MQLQQIAELLLSIPLSLQIGVVVALGLLFLIYSTMAKNKGFKQKILQSKKVKSEVVRYLSNTLQTIHYLTNKTIKDNEVIGMYNTETVILGLRALSKLEKVNNNLHLLEDGDLTHNISNYTDYLKETLSGIYNMEDHFYEYKKGSEQTILAYDRAFHRLNSDKETMDEAMELKKEFKKELEAYKYNLNELENTCTKKREQFHKQLESLNDQNLTLQSSLELYKRKHIDAKRFYARKLVYA